MHDWTGVLLKIQNDEGVVHVYEVDEWGNAARPVTVEAIDHYRHERFGMEPTYVCECGMEYYVWQDVLDHLAIFDDTGDDAMSWPG
jgi:hypothetical protein